MADEESCSDCKLEIIEKIWTQLLLNWLNKCAIENEEQLLNLASLEDVNLKYLEDICCDDFDKTQLLSDLEQFMEFKFPILRLRNLEFDVQRRHYILASVLLYYCCTNTKGPVHADICKKLHGEEQILIIKYCEKLFDMEVTVNNVESAIVAAFTSLRQEAIKTKSKRREIESDVTESSSQLISLDTIEPRIQFKSSITVLPSVLNETSRSMEFSDDSNVKAFETFMCSGSGSKNSGKAAIKLSSGKCCGQGKDANHYCQPDCACSRCSPTGPCCGDPGCSKEWCESNDPNLPKKPEEEPEKKKEKEPKKKKEKKPKVSKPNKPVKKKWYFIIGGILAVLLLLATIPLLWKDRRNPLSDFFVARRSGGLGVTTSHWTWQCIDKLCHKVINTTANLRNYPSFSQCTLLCTGPQIWPKPIGFTHFSETIIPLSTNKMEYKFLSIPSEPVHQYLAEAFKIFLKDLAKLEKNIPNKFRNEVLTVKKMFIQINIEGDADPILRINTDESYSLKVETLSDYVLIKINSNSFCGARHGLETLSQLLLLDESTGNLITLSNIIIQDVPTYRYRGLMVDTVHHFIPITNLIRTIDAMSFCKFNTFHWRMDITSFPLKEKDLFQYGPCDKNMVYTKKDIEFLVKQAGVRGIRVLIEIAVIGSIAGSHTMMESPTYKQNVNYTASASVQRSIFDVFQKVYSKVLQMTKTTDMYHLGENVFHLIGGYYLGDVDFLDGALNRLKMANKGFLPKLPIVWYTPQLEDFDDTWSRFAVQLNDLRNPNLTQFKVIHSTKWDLSCEKRNDRCTKFRTWQQMYSWVSWRNVESFSIEGGEAILWSDLVDAGNLEIVLWPRAAAVAERLWSDMVVNSTVNKFVYVRLNAQRTRMLRRGINVQAIWPSWCNLNPTTCLEKVH